ncbi:hypothetical protein Trco_006385 [Trichoderma cornu-damae]|uniref:Uncharacterized protein n=1 Tax=Trichoderma cornu-damae TaxID=654480 RepID=A0A9P8QL20_9HYPO|nr:hypothetical protein Trco_006385 [Trichoderma cornu-damae]
MISDMLLFLRMGFLFKLTRELDFDSDTLEGPIVHLPRRPAHNRRVVLGVVAEVRAVRPRGADGTVLVNGRDGVGVAGAGARRRLQIVIRPELRVQVELVGRERGQAEMVLGRLVYGQGLFEVGGYGKVAGRGGCVGRICRLDVRGARRRRRRGVVGVGEGLGRRMGVGIREVRGHVVMICQRGTAEVGLRM